MSIIPHSGKDYVGGVFVKNLVREFWYEEDGLQTVELVLILVILISLVVVMRGFAETWLNQANDAVNSWIQSIPGI